MTQESAGIRAFIDVVVANLFDKSGQLRRPFWIQWICFDQICLYDIEKYMLKRTVAVWRLTISQLYHKDSKGPDISAHIVFFLAEDDLGRHPTGCSNFGISPLNFLSQLGGILESTQFEVPVLVEE